MINSWFKNGSYLGLAMLLVAMGSGCASTEQTTKTETTVTSPDGASTNGQDGVVTKSETTTTTTETPAESPGVLSSALHAVGYVLILPFIIVGGLFKIIFGG